MKTRTGLGLAGILIAAGTVSYLAMREEAPSGPVEEPVTQPAPRVQTPTQQAHVRYTVKKGDYLSKIAYDRGFRGHSIYDKVLEIQNLSGLGPERDIYKTVDGELVRGQDGYVDLIYPGEVLVLN